MRLLRPRVRLSTPASAAASSSRSTGSRARAPAAPRLVLLRQRHRGRRGAADVRARRRATWCSGTTATGTRAQRVPAIVGAFPEPFVHGVEGKRRPVRLECARRRTRRRASDVRTRSSGVGVPAVERVARGARAEQTIVRVVVATWDARAHRARRRHARGGPGGERRVRALRDGRPTLELLDERGDVARAVRRRRHRARGRALRPRAEELVWLVTGARRAPASRRRRARARRATQLRDAFAVAATPGGPSRSCRCGVAMTPGPGLPQPRPSPLHTRARRRRRRLLLRVRARAARSTATRSSWPRRWSAASGGRGRRAGSGARSAASLRLALPLALLIARRSTRSSTSEGRHAALPRRRGARPPHRRDARGARRRGAGRAAGRCVLVVALGAVLRGRRSRRAAAARAARLLPLGADRRRSPRGSCRCSPATRCAWATPRAAGRGPPAALAVARAALAGALDRAVDVAAALELRGYAIGGRPPRCARPWSRHDVRVGGAAAGDRGAGAGGPRRRRRRGSRPTRRSRSRPARPRSRSPVRWSRSAPLPFAGRGGAAGGGACLSRVLRAEGFALPLSGRARGVALRDVDARARARLVHGAGGRVGLGQVDAAARACGLVPHFHGGEAAGELTVGGLDVREHGPGELAARLRHRLPGPRDAGRDERRARRARAAARAPRRDAGGGRARGRGGGAGARASRTCSTAAPTRSRAASCSASRSRRRWRTGRRCWCSTSRPRSSTRSPATSSSGCCGG